MHDHFTYSDARSCCFAERIGFARIPEEPPVLHRATRDAQIFKVMATS
jgi:hypothetical protein